MCYMHRWSIGFALSEIFSHLALPRLLYDYVINFLYCLLIWTDKVINSGEKNPVKYERLIITGWSIGFPCQGFFSPLALSRLLYDYEINFCIACSYELIKW